MLWQCSEDVLQFFDLSGQLQQALTAFDPVFMASLNNDHGNKANYHKPNKACGNNGGHI